MTATQLDPSAGFYLKGATVDAATFIAAVQFRQLRAVTRDPMTLQTGSSRHDDDPDLEAEREIHDLVQRAVTGTKKSNVARYADYIAGIAQGQVGVLPPIHLWTQQELDTFETPAGTFVLVPLGDTLLSIDGETQLTAHWRIAKARLDEYDKTVKDVHTQMPLSVVIHHGVPTQVARQYFHDLNILAVRPNVGIGLAMDTTDPIMSVVNDIETLPVLAGKVDRQSRQLPKRSDKVVTLSALRQMVINIALGMTGVQFGSRPAPIDEDQLRELRTLAPKVVEDFFGTFEKQIADREGCITGTAPVLAAVGAMAQPLMDASPAEQNDGIRHLLGSLDQVDWTRGETWQGIAGDFTSRGIFSVKGTKEVSYAVHNALTDPRNPAYHRVRHDQATTNPVVGAPATGERRI